MGKYHTGNQTLVVAGLAASLFFCSGTALIANVASGGDMQLVSSAIDNGGGEKLEGGEYFVRGAIAQSAIQDTIGPASGGDYANRKGFYNPPHFVYQKALPIVLTLASGDVTLTIPSNSIDLDVFDITMNRNPLSQPLSVDPDIITSANNKMLHNEGVWAQLLPGNLSEISIFDEQDFYGKPLSNRGLLAMRYRDDNNDGVIDASNPPVRVDTLSAWGLDETRNTWVQLPDAGADRAARTLSVYFGVPGVYALFGAMDQSVRNVMAYPVPFRPNGPQAGSGQGQTGTEADGITFDSVPQTGDIEIYTLDGRLVRKIPIPANLTVQTVKWDVKTASGARAASGVYIWRVVSGSNSKTGKLMVIW